MEIKKLKNIEIKYSSWYLTLLKIFILMTVLIFLAMRYLSEPLGMVDSGGLFLFGFGLFFMLPYLFIFLVVLSLSKFLFDRYIKKYKNNLLLTFILSIFLFGYN